MHTKVGVFVCVRVCVLVFSAPVYIKRVCMCVCVCVCV